MQYLNKRYWQSVLFIVCCIYAGAAMAQEKSEDLLIDKLILNLRSKDPALYSAQFAQFDSVWRLVNKIVPASPAENQRLANIKSHPEKLRQFDPAHNQSMETDFKNLIVKGIDSGIHWTEIRLVRYELEKMLLTKDMIGFEKVAQHRLQGYVYIMDQLTSRVYAVAVKNIFSFDNKWYGGQVVNVLEAQNIEEYLDKLALERKIEKERLLAEMYGTAEDPIEEEKKEAVEEAPKKEKNFLEIDIEEDEDDGNKAKRNREEKVQLTKVLDRKLYTGVVDGEIKIELYLRSLQGNCPDPICGWEAIYKFGDNEEYYMLEVKRKPDGKWSMIEDTEEGALELTLNNGVFTGIWQSPQDKTEYKVEMTEKTDVKVKKLYMLDDLIQSY